MTTSPADLVREAFYDRLTGLDELVAAVNHSDSQERIYWGRPEKVHGKAPEEVAATEHPYVTFFGVPGRDVVPNVGRVRIQTDIWVWADAGGIAKVKEIDGILYEEFYEENDTFVHGGNRFSVGSTSWREDPPTASKVLHRIREFGIGVHNRVGA